MGYDHSLQELIFKSFGKKYRLTRTKNFQRLVKTDTNSPRQILPSPTHDLIFVRQLIQIVSTAELQRLLDQVGQPHNHLHEDQVRLTIATLFMNGTLGLFDLTDSTSAAPPSGSSSSVKKSAEVCEQLAPEQFQSPASLIINNQASSKTGSAPRENVIDEQALVKSLVSAAAVGTPLCEVCMDKAS